MPTPKADDKCEHGHTCYNVSTFDAEGVTACCGAFYSVFSDDGSLYCKCCYGSVWADDISAPVVTYRVELPPQ
jgi:hypothetical protein